MRCRALHYRVGGAPKAYRRRRLIAVGESRAKRGRSGSKSHRIAAQSALADGVSAQQRERESAGECLRGVGVTWSWSRGACRPGLAGRVWRTNAAATRVSRHVRADLERKTPTANRAPVRQSLVLGRGEAGCAQRTLANASNLHEGQQHCSR